MSTFSKARVEPKLGEFYVELIDFAAKLAGSTTYNKILIGLYHAVGGFAICSREVHKLSLII